MPKAAKTLATEARGAALRVGARVAVTRAEGPGARFALWLQGCSIRCPGCCNPHLFDDKGGSLVERAALLAEVVAVRGEIEGVTLLGGEPFEQAESLAPFARGARELGLSVMTFSGYTLEELRTQAASRTAFFDLLAVTDVLVDGRYAASRPEQDRRWAGSANQRFHYLTDRYTPCIEHPAPDEPLRAMEIRIGADGRVTANGWPALRATGTRDRGPSLLGR
jgi:anaerobic ribonucleoside-triphosphate reductase activating protein